MFRLDRFVSDDPVVVQGSFYRIMHARSVGDAAGPVAVKVRRLSSSGLALLAASWLGRDNAAVITENAGWGTLMQQSSLRTPSPKRNS